MVVLETAGIVAAAAAVAKVVTGKMVAAKLAGGVAAHAAHGIVGGKAALAGAGALGTKTAAGKLALAKVSTAKSALAPKALGTSKASTSTTGIWDGVDYHLQGPPELVAGVAAVGVAALVCANAYSNCGRKSASASASASTSTSTACKVDETQGKGVEQCNNAE